MNRENNKKTQVKVPQTKKNNKGTSPKFNEKKLIIVVISAFLALLILFGAIFGIVIAVKNSSYVMSYGSVGIDEGVATYLTSYFKSLYMKNLAAGGTAVDDTEEFWSKLAVNNNTFGDYLQFETESYLKQIIAANYLFDKYLNLSRDEKRDIELAIEEKLDYLAGGSVSNFNDMASSHGFDYDDFKKGTELLYKYWFAREKIFGENGQYMLEFPDEVEEYYKSYSHVKLLFVRTESDFLLDENGNRVPDDEGNDKTVELSDEKKAERLESIEYIKGVIADINSGNADGAIFDQLLRDYDGGDRGSHTKGYYFNKNASYTKSFAEEFEKIVNLSFELEIGKAVYTECSVGGCFIYRIPREEGAYTDTSDDWCFSDFFANASVQMFSEMLNEIAENVEIREKWSNIDPIFIPYQSEFIARF